MNREQFKNLNRVLRKLLQGNGPKVANTYGSRFGKGTSIEEAYSEMFGTVCAAHGLQVARALSVACSQPDPTRYVWTSTKRRWKFEDRRADMGRK